MKKLLLLSAIVILWQTNLDGRLLYFPKANYKDSISFAQNIKQLAVAVLEENKAEHKPSITYFDQMWRYALSAEYYEESIAYLDSLRILMRPDDSMGRRAIAIHGELYALARIQQKREQGPFEPLFAKIFDHAYAHLDENARVIAAQYAGTDFATLQKKLDGLIEKCSRSDSLSLEDAGALVAAHNSCNVIGKVLPVIRQRIQADEEKEFIITKELIKVRDGSTLQAVVVRKRAVKGKMPAILVMNIYEDSAGDKTIAKRYAVNGYVGIVANTRGKGLSPQEIEPFEHDAKDAYDVIDWISRQKYSNGKVGMVGGSYLGFAQWAAAKNIHPALKTIMPQVAVGIGIDYPMDGNVFSTYTLRWIHMVTNNKGTDKEEFYDFDRWGSLYLKWYREGESFRSLDTMDGRPSNIFQRWLQHPSFDSYWQNMVACGNDFAKINIPVLTTTGYFDDDQIGALYYFRQHYLHNPGANHYLVIGPYSHSGAQRYPEAEIDGYTVDSVATSFNFVDLSVQWFNYVLKGSTKPALLQDKVNYEVMGANRWNHAPTLAAMSNNTRRFYFSNTRVNEHYKLTNTGVGEEYIRQEVDMTDRSDSAEREYYIIDSAISVNNRISFISEPLQKSVILNGAFTAQMKLAVNKQDVDLMIELYELMPDGRYFNLSSGLQRASYALDRSHRQLLQPGKKEIIPVTNALTTSKQLQKGSRLVVLIGVNKSANWQLNYGTGKDVSDETIKDAGVPFDIKWFTDSYIDIPLWE